MSLFNPINPRQTWIAAAAALAAVAVMLGALGAHALQGKLTEIQLESYDTAVRYQCVHALALFAMGSSGVFALSEWHRWAARLWLAGIILFSGSIYLLVFREHLGIESWKSVLGPITPIGGLLLIVGWLLLCVGAILRSRFPE
jgi:uncharacterized membrane protein YgdD (TMEM256/DUF423 family)